jgi:hypothetical protein
MSPSLLQLKLSPLLLLPLLLLLSPLLLLLLVRPEPYEFMESAGKMKLERVASTAAHR